MRGGVEEEVGPVGVRLHELEFGDLAQAEAEDLRADPIALVLCEVGSLGHADAFHALHGEDLGAGCFVDDGGDEEGVLLVSEEVLEAFAAIGFADVVAFPGQLGACVGDGFLEVEAFW